MTGAADNGDAATTTINDHSDESIAAYEPMMMMVDTATAVAGDAAALGGGGFDEMGGRQRSAPVLPLVKARSLEDLCRGTRTGGPEAGSQASHEMEFMSSRIQKLKVQD